ncbi:hypothetical protein H6F88_17480 [Oculatella sp. FACHB-28]|uniref:hypothetical protein n=1 Tax=Oculatella sp. FACHB-28 TaxID=2692845 RepID=UPI0016895BA8|nr:hypothetical protein [Oculatella sp. FACHB-28]MBD2057789.1 hypothetical protein [Oculatella sp. FACHB-28]
MSEPVSKSVNQTVTNLLTVLAQQGDPDAIAALERANELVEEDGAGSVKVVLDTAEGNHLITQHGASFLSKIDQEGADDL